MELKEVPLWVCVFGGHMQKLLLSCAGCWPETGISCSPLSQDGQWKSRFSWRILLMCRFFLSPVFKSFALSPLFSSSHLVLLFYLQCRCERVRPWKNIWFRKPVMNKFRWLTSASRHTMTNGFAIFSLTEGQQSTFPLSLVASARVESPLRGHGAFLKAGLCFFLGFLLAPWLK